jgi:regulator of protease activity HflC (stomatin/prohibitin superfamily)
MARERFLHRRRGPPRCGHPFRQIHRNHAARRALAPAVPIEDKELVDFSQVRTVEVGYRNTPKNKKENEALMLTDDENIIEIQFAVQYNLKSAEAYLFNVRKPDLIVQFIAQTAMGEVVGKAKMDFVLYEGREQIAKSSEKLMQELWTATRPASTCRR